MAHLAFQLCNVPWSAKLPNQNRRCCCWLNELLERVARLFYCDFNGSEYVYPSLLPTSLIC